MEKIIIKRGGGKTVNLIKMSAQTGDYIICHNIHEANRIQKVARDLGYDIPLPITYHEFLNGNYGKRISGFLIDNIEMFLQGLSDVPIKAISLNP